MKCTLGHPNKRLKGWLMSNTAGNEARVLWCANQVQHNARMTMTSFVHRSNMLADWPSIRSTIVARLPA